MMIEDNQEPIKPEQNSDDIENILLNHPELTLNSVDEFNETDERANVIGWGMAFLFFGAALLLPEATPEAFEITIDIICWVGLAISSIGTIISVVNYLKIRKANRRKKTLNH